MSDERPEGLSELPMVAGPCARPLWEVERACLVHLADEQARVNPDNALISTLCDAVRIIREYPAPLVPIPDEQSTALARLREEADELRDVLRRNGYRRCDVAACNCNGWHGGHCAQRLTEIGDALEAAGIETNGRTILAAVKAALSSPSASENGEQP